MDPTNIAIIFDLTPPSMVKHSRDTLVHTRYYIKFIRGYVEVTTPMEKLLNKDIKFQWNEQCQESMYALKNNMVRTPILVFPYWKKEFHVHVDASFATFGIVLEQPGECSIDHTITFASRRLPTT